jgi:hypothetical protein
MQRMIRSFALALILLIPAAGAVQARPLAVRAAPVGFFEELWRWVSAQVPGWVKAGGAMDPNGTPHNPLAPLPTTDAGGDLDPNGRQ